MKKEFTNRFMPNVKFKGNRDTEVFLNEHDTLCWFHANRGSVYGFKTSEDGSMIFAFDESLYHTAIIQEVSVYEAIPELIPHWCRYEKELDKFVPDYLSYKVASKEDLKVDHRLYNIGSSNYASLKIQPWDVWKDWKLDPWDADIVKRISRTKEIPGKSFQEARIEDYEKIKHICDEKISQLKEKNDN